MAFDLSSVGAPIDERYPNDMAVQAIGLIEAARPDWIPRNASPEVVLIEALALACADVANAANQAVAELAEVLLATFYQVPRRPGAPAAGELTVTFDAAVSTTIPAGTRFALADYRLELASTADVVVSSASTAVVPVATVVATSLVNGVGASAGVDVLDVVPNLLSVAVSSAFASGADPEDDAAYIARARLRFARVTNSLVVVDHFAAFCLEDGRASNALCIGAWDGTAVGTIGSDAGEVSVVTYGFGGNLSSTVRGELAAAMQAITAEGVTVHVVEADVTTVNVTVVVKAMPGFSSGEVSAAVEAAVRGFLDPQVWVIGDDVIKNQLQDRVTSLPQVDFVTSLTAPAADVTIPADGVALAGTVSVTVT